VNVPILRIPFTKERKDKILQNIGEVLETGMMTNGTYTRAFEEKFRSRGPYKYSVATNSCTSALEMILRSLDVTGGTVIVPTNTFSATPLAALHAGSGVIFVDCRKEDFSIDPEDLKRKIRKDTKAVVVVHIGGIISSRIREIKEICGEKGIPLVEDCAHAHGCSFDGTPAGAWGVAGAFSFFPTKVLVTGEGGMIVTSSEEVYKNCVILRNHGKNPALKNRITGRGHNWKISEFSACIGTDQVENADWINKERQRAAFFYDERLKGMDIIKPLELDKRMISTYYKYICMIDDTIDRLRLKKIMKETYGVSLTGEVYGIPCHEEPYFKNDRSNVLNADDKFPNTDYIKTRHICLPCYPGLKDDELSYVIDSLKVAVSSMNETSKIHVSKEISA